jgi:hypothetical protein
VRFYVFCNALPRAGHMLKHHAVVFLRRIPGHLPAFVGFASCLGRTESFFVSTIYGLKKYARRRITVPETQKPDRTASWTRQAYPSPVRYPAGRSSSVKIGAGRAGRFSNSETLVAFLAATANGLIACIVTRKTSS